MKDNAENGICWGYFSTIPAFLSFTYNARYGTSQAFPYRVCLIGGLTITQVIAIFLEYAKRHPERYMQDAYTVELVAMKEAFPCPIQKR